MRDLPNVALSPCPASYARPLAQSLDTVQEALALTPSPALVELLEKSQAAARELSDNLEATVEIGLGGERVKAHATGARGGFRWRLENDDLLILIGSPKRDWTISVRYKSAGLWEHGLEALRVRAFDALRYVTVQRDVDCIRVSRADFCFDFWSPTFSREFVSGLAGNVVCHSSAKANEVGSYQLWTRGGRGETLTIGSRTGLQVQLYDKTLEIDEASGKTWLYDIWIAGLDGEWVWASDKPRDVWRLECRFGGTFLKDRNIRRPHEFAALLPELIGEALYTRRLTVPNPSDSDRKRWPIHPLFSEAVRLRGGASMLPVGRKVTGRRAALLERANASLAGNLRTISVLETGEYNSANVLPFVNRAIARIEEDPAHVKKEQVAKARYSDVDDAK